MASPFIAFILDMQKFLSQKPGISDIKLFTHLPAERISISEWERKNACQLPDDLKSFYLTSDGVQMQWCFKCNDVKTAVGRINLNPVSNLAPIKGPCDPSGDKISFRDLDVSDSDEDTKEQDVCLPSVGCQGCRAFQLEACDYASFVCLVYRNCRPSVPATNPEIWLLDRAFRWHFMVTSFTQYYRLMLMHLGLPLWQHLVTGLDIPPQIQQWYNLYAPLRLEMDLFTLAIPSSYEGESEKSPLDPARVFKPRVAEKKKSNAVIPSSTAKGKRLPGAAGVSGKLGAPGSAAMPKSGGAAAKR